MFSFWYNLNFSDIHEVAWPSGLRRWFKAPVSSEAWVRIPPLPNFFIYFFFPFTRSEVPLVEFISLEKFVIS